MKSVAGFLQLQLLIVWDLHVWFTWGSLGSSCLQQK